MESTKLRKMWNEFWESKNHKYLAEANIFSSAQDNTTLFNQAWMQQLVPNLAGKPHKLGKRLFNIQKCVRTWDIDEVGDRSHLTFFEMMGNWSLGDYFKEDSVKWSWEFLTEYLKIDPRKLAVTVFEGDSDAPRDDETANFWKEVWISNDKLSYLWTDDNRRSPGPVGPCWADTEIFYWIWDRNGFGEFPPKDSNVQTDENNWMEIWNNVFMEFYRDEDGFLTKLKSQNVDTGMGFERMCCVLQNKDTVFETDLFAEIIAVIEKHTELKYSENERRMRIIADHLRTACIMIDDGGISSNTGAGYILRMIIRRMYYNLILLKNLDSQEFKIFLNEIIDKIIDLNKHRNFNSKLIKKNIINEIEHFRKTISRGLKILSEDFLKGNNKTLVGKDAFMLYDTYGFPIELTKEICDSKNVKIDINWFKEEMKIAKERSRNASKDMFNKWIDRSKYLEWIEETKFIWYDIDQDIDCEIKLIKDFEIDSQRILILNKTSFYAESWGQTGDFGEIVLDSGETLKIVDVKKYEGVFLHFVGKD